MLLPTPAQPWDERLRAGGRLPDVNAVFDMHHQGYVARLTEALGQRYEGMWWVLGDDDFFALCRDYIAQRPSRGFNLNFYGDDFPEWAAAHILSEELPFLGDLGRYERSFFRLFHAADPSGVTAETFQEYLQGGSALVFGEGVELFESAYAVYDLWQCRHLSHECEEDLPDVEKPTRVLLYRFKGTVYVKDFEREEFALLSALMSGGTSEILQADTFAPQAVSNVFSFLLSAGVVEGLKAL